MRLREAWLTAGLACLLGVALTACASTEKKPETPISAESEERIAEPPPPVGSDVEMSMEFEDEEEDESRDEYIPPPTQTYSPAAKLKGNEEAPTE